MLQSLPPEPPAEVIVVTGTPLPQTAADAANHVDIIDGSRLANSPARELDAILVQVPGLQLFRRSDSTSGHPTSQGVTLRALGGNASSRALLTLDGVPQADPFGGWVNWPAYDAAGLAEARIVRGGGSVSQGPGALAGIIELQSRTRPGADATIEAGSRASIRGHAYWGTSFGTNLLTVDGQAARSDGFIPVTEATRGPIDQAARYREASLRARWTTRLGKTVELQAAGLGFADERDRGVPFTANRTRGADLSLRLLGRGRWQWSALGYSQWRNLRSSFASLDDNRTAATRVSLQDSVPSRGLGGRFELRPPIDGDFDMRIGADARFVTGESRELFSFLAGEPTRRRIAGGDSGTAGVFAETNFHRGALTLSAGARLDHWRVSDGALIERSLATGLPSRDESYPDRTGWRPTARASMVFKVSPEAGARVSAYSGWRLPTLNELFRPFRAGADATAANPLLQPERLVGVEAGFHYRRAALDLDLTAFANRLSDAIANVTMGHGPGTFAGVGFVAGNFRQRQNIDAVNVRGVEASAGYARGPWSLRIGASWTHARVAADDSAAPLDGLRPAQTPALVVTGTVGWEDRDRTISLMLRHVGAQYEDDLNQQRLAPATTLDGLVAWPVSRHAHVIVRAQNLLDEEVQAGIADDGAIERATPRTLWIGLRLGSE